MRQSEWKENFHDSLLSTEDVDTGWKKSSITKVRIQFLLMRGLASQLDEYSESYILLKKTNKK